MVDDGEETTWDGRGPCAVDDTAYWEIGQCKCELEREEEREVRGMSTLEDDGPLSEVEDDEGDYDVFGVIPDGSSEEVIDRSSQFKKNEITPRDYSRSDCEVHACCYDGYICRNLPVDQSTSEIKR